MHLITELPITDLRNFNMLWLRKMTNLKKIPQKF